MGRYLKNLLQSQKQRRQIILKNRIEINYNNICFEADILLEQKPYFSSCYKCAGDGRQTFITLKEIVDMAKLEEVSVRSRTGIAIKKALLEKFDGRYICGDCATKKWEIIIPSIITNNVAKK